MLSRRGFLKTLGAALATAAVFEPKSLLWLPKVEARAVDLIVDPTDAVLRNVIAKQEELNALALTFAKTMGERLERTRAVALHEVLYQMNGNVLLAPEHLFLNGDWHEDLDASRFATGPRTMIVTDARKPDINHVSGEMLSDLRGVDMFVPIGTDLRPGEPFAIQDYPWGGRGPTLVGVATDPESGISARAITVERTSRKGYGGSGLIGFEIAAGRWQKTVIEQPAPIVAYCPDCAIGLSDDGYGDYYCLGCHYTWSSGEVRRV